MAKQLYCHTVPVTYAGTGKRGTAFKDAAGGYYLVPGHGAEALATCIGTGPKKRGESPCQCGWEGIRYKCGGSCEMRFGKGGCE